MEWEVVKVNTNTNKNGKTTFKAEPYASVGARKLVLNTAACELISNYEECKYVELLKGQYVGKSCVGVRFLTEEECTDDSIKIVRRIRATGIKDKNAQIHCQRALIKLFGDVATASKMTKYCVEKDEESDNILIIFVE